MGDLLVLAILILIVALIIRSMIRDKKAGRSPLCGGDCKECGRFCHQVPTREDSKNS
ncbi:MAG: FeoB-associated Cys-rich membrane protein [Clostridiales bacterium]|nr:FeoB-associated Cys-rich membrane protein [Clostridiales bacterium]